MKIAADAAPLESAPSNKTRIQLPFGLIGFRNLTEFELQPLPDAPPLQSLRAHNVGPLDLIEFVVMEPTGVLDNYAIALRDEDVESLRINSPEDALILNIVSIHSLDPQYVTVNLVGPVVVNRHTMIGQQVIIANNADFSIDHVLVDQRPGAAQESPSTQPPHSN